MPYKDPEERKKYLQQYYADNKEFIKIKRKEWYQKNKDKIKESRGVSIMSDKTKEELLEENTRLRKVLSTSFPERSGDIFICGSSKDVSSDGLPRSVTICPTYGSDYFVTYIRVK